MSDVGTAVERLQAMTRREAMEIRMRANADAETAAAAALGEANGAIDRRISRLRELRTELAEASARIERDMTRVAEEIRRRTELTHTPRP